MVDVKLENLRREAELERIKVNARAEANEQLQSIKREREELKREIAMSRAARKPSLARKVASAARDVGSGVRKVNEATGFSIGVRKIGNAISSTGEIASRGFAPPRNKVQRINMTKGELRALRRERQAASRNVNSRNQVGSIGGIDMIGGSLGGRSGSYDVVGYPGGTGKKRSGFNVLGF